VTHTEDLILRLRDTASRGVSAWGDLQQEAADELETLMNAVAAEREALAQPVQEPDLTAVYMSGLYDGKKKRKWVGLTDDEVNAAWGTVAWNSSKGLTELRYEYARNIETKLKEKNT
jgi:hypothetical protein